jgi:hypothetical protein
MLRSEPMTDLTGCAAASLAPVSDLKGPFVTNAATCTFRQ